MNSAVIIASLAIVVLAILMPTEAVPTVYAEAHKDAKSYNAQKDETVAATTTVQDLGDVNVIDSTVTKTKSDDWDAKQSSSDEKLIQTENGMMKQKTSSVSTQSYDYDEETKTKKSELVPDKC